MAYKNPFRLTIRRQGEIVGQIYKFICCYSDFFVPRTRVYLKEVSKVEDTMYWLENAKTNEVTAIALVEPKYKINIDGIEIITVGHTLSKINNQMPNILDHLLGDYQDKSIMILSRSLFAGAMQLEEKYGFVSYSPDLINIKWPDLAGQVTDYFNLASGETLFHGLNRKGYNVYLRLLPIDIQKLKKKNPELISDFVHTETKKNAQSS
jgi:hypothetical protein